MKVKIARSNLAHYCTEKDLQAFFRTQGIGPAPDGETEVAELAVGQFSQICFNQLRHNPPFCPSLLDDMDFCVSQLD